MNTHLEYLASSLRGYGQSLEKKASLTNKPWTLIDDDGEIHRLIFKGNGELVLSRNGNASVGKWEYLPGAKSLLIDRTDDKLLLNEFLVLDGLLVLKKDGTSSDFVVFCNEDRVPDLNPIKYLQKARAHYLNVINVPLNTGQTMELSARYLPSAHGYKIPVTVEGQRVEDGIYYRDDINMKYIVSNSHKVSRLWFHK